MTFFKNFNYGEALIEGLQQALVYAKGDKNCCRVTIREIPGPEYKVSNDYFAIASMIGCFCPNYIKTQCNV